MSTKKTMSDVMKIIVFGIGNEEYGVEVGQVRSIEREQHITRVPKTPSFVRGVINLRGVITPVIDLRTRFDLEYAEFTESTRIIIVQVEEMEVGIIVDSANDVVDISADNIERPPAVVGGIEAAYLRGIAKDGERLLILLNLDKVLSEDELKQVKEIELTS